MHARRLLDVGCLSLLLAGGLSATEYEVGPEDVALLPGRVYDAEEGDIIRLRPGTYHLPQMLHFRTPNVTLGSTTGVREDVLLDGGYDTYGGSGLGEVIGIEASGVVIENVSIAHAMWHGIHLWGGSEDVENVLLENLHVYDCGQQLIKSNPAGDPSKWVDSVTVQNSLIEFIDNSVMQPSGGGYYTGGLDVHAGRGWVVRDNVFRGISREGAWMEHAIHFWRKGRDVIIERNLVANCYRGIGFGLAQTAGDNERHYSDGAGDDPYRDQIAGIIRNNMVVNDPGIFMDTGIAVANTVDSKVYHNSVVSGDAPAPFNCIEYRWSDSPEVRNNLVSHQIMEREDNTLALETHNVEDLLSVTGDYFENAGEHNLRLLPSASLAIDQALPLPDVFDDFYGYLRGGNPDIGASELQDMLALNQGNRSDLEPAVVVAYPNPFSTHIQIEYHLQKAAHTTLHVYDVAGREVATRIIRFQPAGRHVCRLPVETLPPGNYFYWLKASGKVLSGSITKLKQNF